MTLTPYSIKGVSALLLSCAILILGQSCLAGSLAHANGLGSGAAGQDAALIQPTFDTLSIDVSKGTLIRLDRPAAEVFIANPEIADVQVKSPRLVYIFGNQRGETSFYALDARDEVIYSSTVQVTQPLTMLRSALRQMLPDSALDASLMGNRVVLKGYVASPDASASAEEIAQQIVGGNVINRITVMQPTQVNLRVRFAEVSRTVLKELAFNLESFAVDGNFISGALIGRDVFTDTIDELGQPLRLFNRGDGSTIVGGFRDATSDFNYAIDALDNEGFLTILAEPNLTAISGETANFLAGGEFPIPIPSRDGLGVQYREFGVRLDFTPTVLDSGRIYMRVAPEVSDLSNNGAIRLEGISVPALSTRRAETTIELGSGQSFAIAGLLQNEVNQVANKFPGLGDIPILGALFRSEDFRREESELLIVVTPYLVRPVSSRKLALPTDGFRPAGDFDRFARREQWRPRQAEAATAATAADGPSIKQRAGFQVD